ncbi:hypothetical protein ACOMHN_022591 [Nucella lapillus]
MEPEVTEKGQRRKLKRVVQKKKKARINLNSSASVAYYKKVKSALNGSLNASRISQTLKANNKALAQSLQHVKQELRYALNENARLRVENQDLTMKLLRMEKYVGAAPEQAGYERRLQGLKAVLNNISKHLLDLGNCVSDGVDLCLVSPRASVEEFKNLEMVEAEASTSQPLPALDLNPLTAECEMDPQWEGEMYGDGGMQSSLGKMTADMSIIMEQSIMVDTEEGQAPQLSCMTAVPEDSLEISKSGFGSKKVSALPQRVLNGGSAKNSKCEKESLFKEPASNIRPLSTRIRNKLAGPKDGTVPEKASASVSPPCPRRETYVVGRNVEKVLSNATETSSTGSIEDISNIPMPDLVSASPMKDDHEREVFDPDAAEDPKQNTAQDPQDDRSPTKSQSDETSHQNTLAVDNIGSTSDTVCKEKRKSTGKKNEPAPAKQTKASMVKTSRVTPPSKKDADFFISNPCVLNLVHKRVTGSSDGCLGSAQQSQEQSQPEASVDQFMAHIKESNRNSTKLASFLVVDDASANQKTGKSSDNRSNINKSRRSFGAAFEFQSEDQTVYFNSDMEFTEVLPQSQNLAQEQTRKARKEEAKTQLKGKKKEDSGKEENRRMARSKSRHADVSDNEPAVDQIEEVDIDKLTSGPDKKLAVALRVSKPGQMVFAASRKEEDGSRKAIPAKLQSKSRSKSKKQVEEMAKNLPQKESECIFDFHDQTPRPSAAEGKTNQGHGSVFDLSLNDTIPGITTSLASHREKLKVSNNVESTTATEGRSKGKGEKASSVLLGDAPVYSVPLKDDSNELESQSRSQGRSSSKSRDTGRQSRSHSRSRKEEKEQDSDPVEEDSNELEHRPRSRGRSSSRSKDRSRQSKGRSRSRKEEKKQVDGQSRPSRSRSRARMKTETVDDDANKEVDENIKSDAGKGRKSESAPNEADTESGAEKPRRSARSRSRTYTKYAEDNPADDVISPSAPSPKEKKTVQGRSRSRVKKCEEDDEDYVPSARAQPRGRSRRRQGDDQPSGTEQNPAQPREKSRSRRRDVVYQSSNIENELATSVTSTNQDLQEPQSDSASTEKSSDQKSNSSHDKVGDDLLGKETNKPVNEEKTDSVESQNSDIEPLKLITDRRQRSRSKSALKKLYSEADMSDDPFGFSAAVDNTDSDSQPITVFGKQVKHRTRSRGTGLLEKEGTDGEILKDSPESSVSKQDGISDKRKLSRQSESERDVSPSKKICRWRKRLPSEIIIFSPEKGEDGLLKATEKTQTVKVTEKQTEPSKDSSNSAAPNTPVLKKRRSGLPVAVFQAGEEVDKSPVSTGLGKTKSKSVSRLPEPKSSEKVEKIKYQLEFEEVKQKLKELDHAQSSKDSDSSFFPVKKSRPLVLSTTSTAAVAGSRKPVGKPPSALNTDQANSKATASSKKSRTQPASPKTRKGSLSQPGSPTPKTSASTSSSASSSPKFVESRSCLGQSEPTDESSQADGRRGRRAAASVCYKEPTLNSKLRRGDPHTTFLHKDPMMHIYKSPKSQRKHSQSDLVNRSALHDLTNASIMEEEK